MWNTPNLPDTDNLKRCWTVDLGDEYAFVAWGWFVVDLREKKSREVLNTINQTPAGSSLELFSAMIPEVNAPWVRDQYSASFSAILKHIWEIPLAMLEEHILGLIDKWYLEEWLTLFEYLLSQRRTDFSKIMEQIILLFSVWSQKHSDEGFNEGKSIFSTKLEWLIQLWEWSTEITPGEKSRVRWLYTEMVIGNVEQASEHYILWVEEYDGWCCFQFGSIFAREWKLAKAKVYYLLGWEESAHTDCLLGLYGIAIQEDDHVSVAQYGQIIRHFGLHKSLNSDPLKFLCNSTTSVETLYAVFESYPQFTKDWLKNLKSLLEQKKSRLSHDSEVQIDAGWHGRSIAYQRMDIMVFEMIAFGNIETIQEVFETVSLSELKEPKRYLSFLLPWLESTPSRSLQKHSLEIPIWSDSIDDLSSNSEWLQSTLPRDQNLWTVDNFWSSGILTYLRIIRSASLILVEWATAIQILSGFIDALWILRWLKYGHIEEIDFLEEELKRQREAIIFAQKIKAEWSKEISDRYKKYRDHVDTNWNTRTRANLVVEVLTEKKDIKTIKDPYSAMYILSEILCFSPENIELLNDIIDYVFTLNLDPSDCAFVWWILARMPMYEEVSLDFLADADVGDIGVLESLAYSYRSLKDPPTDSRQESAFDKLENLFEAAIFSKSRSSSLLDHVRKLFFRTKRKEPQNNRALWVLSFLVWVIAEKQGTYSKEWEFRSTSYTVEAINSDWTPWENQLQVEKRDPSNPALAEKFYKISAEYGYLGAQETLAAIYKDRNDLEESRKYTASSNAQSGYETWAANQFSFALAEWMSTRAFENIRLARLDDATRADTLSLEYSIRGGILEQTSWLKFLMGHPHLIGTLRPETIRKYMHHAKYLSNELHKKSREEWEINDLILLLDILRFQYESCHEEFWHLDAVTYDRIAAERAYIYWTELVKCYKIWWTKKTRKIEKKDVFSTASRRAILIHFSSYFRRDTEEKVLQGEPDLSKMNDIYGDRRDLWLAAMSFPEYSKELQSVLDTTLEIVAVEFLDAVESTSDPMLEVKHLIAVFLSRLGYSLAWIEKAIWIDGLSWEELLNVLIARGEAIRSSVH
jgi:hypothetical protein